jgi:hypothetical protein
MPATADGTDQDDDNEGHQATTDPTSLAPEEEENNTMDETEEPRNTTRTTNFEIDGQTHDWEQCQDVQMKEDEVTECIANRTAELLHIHHRMGHAPFKKLQEMAKQGALPTRLRNCPIPTCAACLYGKASKKAWRSKPTNQTHVKRTLAPGDITSVDQMISSTPGLVAQITGNLTTKRYTCTTIFVDQASRLGYIHLQKSNSAAETLEGKQAWEAYAQSHGITIKAYHADNGIFKDNKWVNKCKKG